MNTRRAFYITVVLTALGCIRKPAAQGPAVIPRPILKADSLSQIDSTTRESVLVRLFHTGTAQYDYRTTSIIRATVGDTIPRVDTISVSALVSATFQPVDTGNLTIQASITPESVVVHTGSSTPVRPVSHTDTIRINVATGKLTLPIQQTSLCDVQTQEALVRTDDLVPTILPTGLAAWSDTLARQVCRAGIKLQAHRVTAYQLDSTTTEIRLLRRSVTTFSGRGIQWNQPVESIGQSVSTDTLVLDLTSQQRIQQIRGATQLQLTFQSQFRNQQFEQLTQLLIQLR